MRTEALLIAALAMACEAPTEVLDTSAAYLAVGAAGTILTSRDGSNWVDQSYAVDDDLLSVTAGPSAIVAVGTAGTILSATDGEGWALRDAFTSGDFSHVIFNGEKFVAVGGDWDTGAIVRVSEDALTWSVVDGPASHMFHAIASGPGWLTAAAYHRSDRQTPALFTAGLPSSNPSAWSEREGPDFYDSVQNGERAFVAGGTTVASSSDGITWDARSLPTPYLASGIAADGTTLVVVGERGTIHRSADGSTWSAQPAPSGERFLASVAGGGGFVAVGASGTILTSSNGEEWTVRESGTSEDLHDVTARKR